MAKPNKAVVQLISNTGNKTPASTWLFVQIKTVKGFGKITTTNNKAQEIMLSHKEYFQSFISGLL